MSGELMSRFKTAIEEGLRNRNIPFKVSVYESKGSEPKTFDMITLTDKSNKVLPFICKFNNDGYSNCDVEREKNFPSIVANLYYVVSEETFWWHVDKVIEFFKAYTPEQDKPFVFQRR